MTTVVAIIFVTIVLRRYAQRRSGPHARSLGPALIGNRWQAHLIYGVGPVYGTLAAARVYNLLRAAKPPAAAQGPGTLGLQGPIG